MRYKHWFVAETRRRSDIALVELREVQMNLKILELKRERVLNRRNELEFILAEILNKREQSLRIQKPTCWAMSEIKELEEL